MAIGAPSQRTARRGSKGAGQGVGSAPRRTRLRNGAIRGAAPCQGRGITTDNLGAGCSRGDHDGIRRQRKLQRPCDASRRGQDRAFSARPCDRERLACAVTDGELVRLAWSSSTGRTSPLHTTAALLGRNESVEAFEYVRDDTASPAPSRKRSSSRGRGRALPRPGGTTNSAPARGSAGLSLS